MQKGKWEGIRSRLAMANSATEYHGCGYTPHQEGGIEGLEMKLVKSVKLAFMMTLSMHGYILAVQTPTLINMYVDDAYALHAYTHANDTCLETHLIESVWISFYLHICI